MKRVGYNTNWAYTEHFSVHSPKTATFYSFVSCRRQRDMTEKKLAQPTEFVVRFGYLQSRGLIVFVDLENNKFSSCPIGARPRYSRALLAGGQLPASASQVPRLARNAEVL